MKLHSIALVIVSTFVFGISNTFAGNSTVKKGVVKSVNTETQEIVLENKRTGEISVYPFPESAKVKINNKKYSDLSVLKAGDEVKLKLRDTRNKKNTDKIKGEIVSIDHDAYSIVIKDSRSNAERYIQFSDNVNVSGRYKVSNFNDLRKGHIIELRNPQSLQPETAMHHQE